MCVLTCVCVCPFTAAICPFLHNLRNSLLASPFLSASPYFWIRDGNKWKRCQNDARYEDNTVDLKRFSVPYPVFQNKSPHPHPPCSLSVLCVTPALHLHPSCTPVYIALFLHLLCARNKPAWLFTRASNSSLIRLALADAWRVVFAVFRCFGGAAALWAFVIISCEQGFDLRWDFPLVHGNAPLLVLQNKTYTENKS